MGFSTYDDTADPAPGAGRPAVWLKALRSTPALLFAVLLTRLWAALLTAATPREMQAPGAAQRLAALVQSADWTLPAVADAWQPAAWPNWLHALLLLPFGAQPGALPLLFSGRLLAVAALTAAAALAVRLQRDGWFAGLLLLHSLALLPTTLLPTLALPLLCLTLVVLRLADAPRDRLLWAALILTALSQPLWLVPLLPLAPLLLPDNVRRRGLLLGWWLLLLAALLALRGLLGLPLLPSDLAVLPAWLFDAAAAARWPDSLLLPAADRLIAVFTLAAVWWLRSDRVAQPALLWLCGGLPLLLLVPAAPTAPTDLPTAALRAPALLPPLLFCAARALQLLWQRFRAWDDYWSWLTVMLPRPPWYAWLALVAALGFVTAIYGSAALTQALGRVGWLHLPAGVGLPAGPYQAAALGGDQRLLLAAAAGSYRADLSAAPAGVLQREPAVRLVAAAGALDWRLSDNGLYAETAGRPVVSLTLPAALGRINAIAGVADGSLRIAASSGAWAAGRDGTLQPLPAVPAGPLRRVVIGPDGSSWFGGSGVVYRLSADGRCTPLPLPKTAAVSALLPLADGTLWIGSSGAGLGRWDGSSLQWQRSADGTSLRLVTALAAGADGAIWVAAANSTTPGGVLLRIDAAGAQRFSARNSGFPDAEAIDLFSTADGRLWIVTRMDGLLVYRE